MLSILADDKITYFQLSDVVQTPNMAANNFSKQSDSKQKTVANKNLWNKSLGVVKKKKKKKRKGGYLGKRYLILIPHRKWRVNTNLNFPACCTLEIHLTVGTGCDKVNFFKQVQLV